MASTANHQFETGRFDVFPNGRVTKITDEEALAVIKETGAGGERMRDPTHTSLQRIWFTAIAYTLGLNSSKYGESVLDDFAFEQSLQIPAYSANHIGRLVRAEVSRLSRARPSMEVTPNSSDQRDVFGAKAAHAVADWIYYNNRLEDLRDALALWEVCCGTAFDFHGWDPRAGKKERVYTDPWSGTIKNAQELPQEARAFYDSIGSFEEVREGDYDDEIISPFQVRVPIGPSEWNDMPWVRITRLMSLDDIWDRWPKKAPEINELEHSSPSIDGFFWRRLASLVHHTSHAVATRGASWLDGLEVHYYVRPVSERFPRGLYIVATDTTVLENGPHPYMTMGVDMRFPATEYHYARSAGRFWGKGFVEDLIGPQEDYNEARRQAIAQRDTHSKPQIITPRQAKLSTTENTNGIMWEYDGRGVRPPEYIKMPQIGSHLTVTREWAMDDLQTLAAQQDATQGVVPTGVRSGAGLRALQERDEMVGAQTYARNERSFQRSMKARLQLFATFVKKPRQVEVYGHGRQADLHYFRGEDLNGNVGIRVVPGSMLPRSRAQQQSLFLDSIQQGFLNPADPEIMRYGLEIMEMGNLQQVLFELDGHRRRANHENEQFLSGDIGDRGWPDVDDDDDHEAHIRRHMSVKVTDSYELLPVNRKLALDGHIAKHRAALAQIAMAPMLMQASMAPQQAQGSPPNPRGEASQPRPAEKNSEQESMT